MATHQKYDAFGQLVYAVDALNSTKQYQYAHGLLAAVTDANGNVTTFAYDGSRRITAVTWPDGAVEAYTYTPDNRLYQRTDRNNAHVQYDYDNLKRLVHTTYLTAGGDITYTYTGQKLTQATDTSVSPTETHVLGYDASYRISSNTQGVRGTVTRLFNADDSVQSYSVESGPAAAYTYYPDGSLDTIVWSAVTGTFKFAYNLVGQEVSISFPNGATRNFAYDNQGRLSGLTNLAAGGTNVASYAYAYDHNWTTGADTMLGQATSLTATVPSENFANALFKYEYDASYQLAKVTYPNVPPLNGEIDSWSYDAIGNRIAATVNGTTTNYSYGKIGTNPLNWQRLLNDGVNAYGYDSNGNTLTRGATAFTWNGDDRMVGGTGGTYS
jgi:YD repeat-containing protein